MIPKPGSALRMISGRLLSAVVPTAGTSFAMSDGAMSAMLLGALAAELEEGVARRLEDGEAMLALLGRGEQAGHIDLPARLPTEPVSMRLADVNAWHDALTAELIVLHERVEVSGDSALNEAIWEYLEATARRHALPL